MRGGELEHRAAAALGACGAEIASNTSAGPKLLLALLGYRTVHSERYWAFPLPLFPLKFKYKSSNVSTEGRMRSFK